MNKQETVLCVSIFILLILCTALYTESYYTGYAVGAGTGTIVQTSISVSPTILRTADYTIDNSYDFANGTAKLTWITGGYKSLYIKEQNPFVLRTIRFYTDNSTGVNINFSVFVSNDNITWYNETVYANSYASSSVMNIQSLYLNPPIVYMPNNLLKLTFGADNMNNVTVQVLKER